MSFYGFRIRCAALCSLAALVPGIPAVANEGVFLSGYDTVQVQRANAGVASPRNASWMIANPGSIVDVENRFDINFYTVFTNAELEPKGLIGNRIGGTKHAEDVYYIPSMGAVFDLGPGKLGLGNYVFSGSGIEWGQSRNLIARLFLSNTDRRLDYQHFRLAMTYAYEFDNGWGIGASLQPSLSRFRTDHLTLRIMPTEGDYEFDNALGIGFGLGIYKDFGRWSVGASYTSRQWVQEFDKYSDFLNYSIDLPHIVQAGISVDVLDNLELSLDYKWLGWSHVPIFGNPIRDVGFAWDDQHGVKVGLEWRAHERFAMRAGWSYTNSPVPDEHVFVAGLVPVITGQHFTAGFSYAVNAQHEVSATYLHAFEAEQIDNGRGDFFSRLARGTRIQTEGNSFSVQYSYKFGKKDRDDAPVVEEAL